MTASIHKKHKRNVFNETKFSPSPQHLPWKTKTAIVGTARGDIEGGVILRPWAIPRLAASSEKFRVFHLINRSIVISQTWCGKNHREPLVALEHGLVHLVEAVRPGHLLPLQFIWISIVSGEVVKFEMKNKNEQTHL